MKTLFLLMLLPFAGLQSALPKSVDDQTAPAYTRDGQLIKPANYRSWTYLTTGFDMSYSASPTSMHMFDNVFVNPSSYEAFLHTGKWPDKTIFVLEQRGAKQKGSINKSGSFQDGELMGMEIHVKDTSRFPGGWAFFSFDEGGNAAKMIPTTAACYSCHQQHAIVDTTFVQFYPTLLEVAKSKGTIPPEHRSEIAEEPASVSK